MRLACKNKNNRLRQLLAVAAVSSVFTGQALAQYGSLASKERVRRQGLVQEAEQHLRDGRSAFAQGDFETAVQEYRSALEKTPDGSLTATRKSEFTAHLSDGSVALAQKYRKVGKYDEARSLLEEVLLVDPYNVSAKTQLEYLDDPIRTNPALTYEHTQNVDKVRRLLYMGEGYYNLGQYDKAEVEFQNVLRIDPYNKASRRWLEKCAAIKSDYYRAAYDETRARLLQEVDKAWEIAVAPEVETIGTEQEISNEGSSGTFITNKLKNIIIPVVDFEDVSVEEAVDFLRLRSRELDNTVLDPNQKGVNFIIRSGSASNDDGGLEDELLAEGDFGSSDPGTARIAELKLRDVPLARVLTYICDQAKLRYRVDEFAVTLLPIDDNGGGSDLITRTWRVTPTFRSDLGGGVAGGGDTDDDPFAATDDDASALGSQRGVQELLSASGVEFKDGASANYIASTSTLIVKNTINNLDLIDTIVERINNKTPKQIKILTKFVEVSQENTDELGFDWNLSTGGSSVLQGGSIGNGQLKTGAANTDGRIFTHGLRSGDGAITRNNIDFIINNANRFNNTLVSAPGVLSLGGVLGSGKFEMVMRGLSQKRGTDIMTAPSITARSGEIAKIEVIRELIYPTEYEPPEIPDNVDGDGQIFPVTPATPTAFETRNTGVTLEIEPTLGSNDYVLDLRFAPEIVEFEGFVNYGSPIKGAAVAENILGGVAGGERVEEVTITENRIEMPVFATRKVTTSLTMYDGHTVAVGGLMREDVQNVEDKVPILGDIPFIGRLFQSKSENRIKSNLILFVTAQIIDATGRPIRGASTSAPADDVLDASLLPAPIN